jgi:DNA-binding beta-propeller fold protein YncE
MITFSYDRLLATRLSSVHEMSGATINRARFRNESSQFASSGRVAASTVTALQLGRVISILSFLIALGSGCASAPGVPRELRLAQPAIVWPSPPEDPKIQYMRSLSGPEDLGITKSFFRKVVEFFFGKTEEKIHQPYGVAADAAGRIYIADSALKVVHVFDQPGEKYWAIPGTSRHAFQAPIGIALDPEGQVYVSDAERRMIFGFDRGGDSFMTIEEGLQRPAGLAFNSKNNFLYVADVLRHEVLVYDRSGKLMFTFGGHGASDGRLNFPTNLAVDREGNIYVTDAMNFRIQIFRPDGSFMSKFGRSGDAVGDLPRPKGIGIDSEGHIYLVEGLYDVVNVFDRQGRLLLTFGNPGSGRGEFWLATGLYVDDKDQIYVADSFNSRVQIFQYLRNGR